VPEKPVRGSFAQAMKAVAPYLNLGWTFAVSLAAGTLGGWWLDRRFGTRPWLLLAGSVLGMITAFVSFFRTVLPSRRDGSEEGEEDGR
jgi:ATP synthase protein I